MIKYSTSNGGRGETVHSDISSVGCVTSDDKVELPNYPVYLPSQNYVIVDIDM